MIEVPAMLLPILFVAGGLFGLVGYSQSRRHAFCDFVAARQRRRIALARRWDDLQ